MQIGAQLYTVRDFCKNKKKFAETLEKIADIGYKTVQLSGRVPCIHLKDHAFDRKMVVIGEGNINFDRVFSAAEKAGTEYMLVEQDNCNKENPFDCLKRSYEFLKSRGFE